MDITMKPMVTAVRWEILARRMVLDACSASVHLGARPLWIVMGQLAIEGRLWTSP